MTVASLAWLLLALQTPAFLTLLLRLLPAPWRRPPLKPLTVRNPELAGKVTVIIPTLNEGERIQACLDGLAQQGQELREVVVIDSRSSDDTVAKVEAMARHDRRFRTITDDPLPPGWVGRPWALDYGYRHTEGEWLLGIDADTQPQPGLVAALVQQAEAEAMDIVTLAPRFILQHLGEAWLQPALLLTLIYRFGAAGEAQRDPERVMANGQCCLLRRAALDQLGGYTLAQASFCDDVTLVREAAKRGLKVGFWDGSQVLQVRMYTSAAETWREWGRSLDLKDAAFPGQTWADVVFLLLVQALPWLLLPLLLALRAWESTDLSLRLLLGLNGFLLVQRVGLQFAIASAYASKPWTYWLAPTADPLAAVRIMLSAASRPKQWRGRTYPDRSTADTPDNS